MYAACNKWYSIIHLCLRFPRKKMWERIELICNVFDVYFLYFRYRSNFKILIWFCNHLSISYILNILFVWLFAFCVALHLRLKMQIKNSFRFLFIFLWAPVMLKTNNGLLFINIYFSFCTYKFGLLNYSVKNLNFDKERC